MLSAVLWFRATRRWLLVGVYVPPSEYRDGGDTLQWIEQATENASDPLIVMGDFNCNLFVLTVCTEMTLAQYFLF